MISRVNIILFLLIIFLILISFIPQKVEFDEYQFTVSPNFKVIREPNDENVLLSLTCKDGVGVIIQNKLNILATTMLKGYKGDDLMRKMHALKHSNYIKNLDGYDVNPVGIDITSNTIFTKQTFKYKNDGIEVLSDLRIVKIDNNFYSLYAMIVAEDKEKYVKILDDIIFSLEAN